MSFRQRERPPFLSRDARDSSSILVLGFERTGELVMTTVMRSSA